MTRDLTRDLQTCNTDRENQRQTLAELAEERNNFTRQLQTCNADLENQRQIRVQADASLADIRARHAKSESVNQVSVARLQSELERIRKELEQNRKNSDILLASQKQQSQDREDILNQSLYKCKTQLQEESDRYSRLQAERKNIDIKLNELAMPLPRAEQPLPPPLPQPALPRQGLDGPARHLAALDSADLQLRRNLE